MHSAPPVPRVAEYLDHLAKERDVSPNTVRAYERDLAEFVEFLGRYHGGGEWSWQGVDRIAMRGFLGQLAKRGLGQAVDGARAVGRAQLLSVSPPQRTRRRESGARRRRTAPREVPARIPRPRADRIALRDGRTARVGRWPRRPAQSRDPRAVLFDRNASLGITGLESRRSRLGDAAGQGAWQGSEGAHRASRRPRRPRAAIVRGASRRASFERSGARRSTATRCSLAGRAGASACERCRRR